MEPSIRNNIGQDPEIRRLNRKPLSDADLRRILGNDTKILKYAELASVPALTQLLPKPTDYCIILYESEMNSGHWVALLRYSNIFEYFDPYGHVVDRPLRWISAAKRKLLKQGEPLLTELLDRSGAEWIYNKRAFEKSNAKINTCGHHCCHRIYRLTHDHMDLKDYAELMEELKHRTGNNYDVIVSDFVEDYDV